MRRRPFRSARRAGLLAAVAMLAALPVQGADEAATGEDLERLARTLGAVHYLRVLCNPGEGQVWRDRMLTLLSAGPLVHDRREALIAAFNAGYGAQASAHPRCTPAAANLGNTYARQGAGQARRLAARLGN